MSSATKTVSDAKAERERRLAERQRLRAICKIQQTWRGYRSRKELAESRRVAFDQLYLSINIPDILQRRRLAFKLLIAFFNAKRDDDVRRLSAFIGEAGPDYLTQICMTEVHKITTYKFTEVLVQALGVLCREEYVSEVDMGATCPRWFRNRLDSMRILTQILGHHPRIYQIF